MKSSDPFIISAFAFAVLPVVVNSFALVPSLPHPHPHPHILINIHTNTGRSTRTRIRRHIGNGRLHASHTLQASTSSLLNSKDDDDDSIEDLWLLEDDDEDDDDDIDDIDDIEEEEAEIDHTNKIQPTDTDTSISISMNTVQVQVHAPAEVPVVPLPSVSKQKQTPIINSTNTNTTTTKNTTTTTTEKDKENDNNESRQIGVGRHGYNMTTLHNIEYEIKKYVPYHEIISYQIRLELLRDYYTQFGDVNVPFRYSCQTYDYGVDGTRRGVYDIALGRWLHNLRKRFQTDANKIPQEFRNELDDMGMNWEGVGAGHRPSTFRNRCEELKQFVHANGHDRVPLYGTDKSFGLWVERQRVLYRKFLEGGDCGGQLTEQRVEMLKGAGFDLDTLVNTSSNGKFSPRQSRFDAEWKRMHVRLIEYQDEHGDFDAKVGLRLGTDINDNNFNGLLSWVAEQKHQHELVRDAFFAGARNLKSILTPERFQALTGTGVGFDFRLDSVTPLPWNDVAKYEFEDVDGDVGPNAMMDLLEQHCADSDSGPGPGPGRCDLFLEDVYSQPHENITDMLKLYTFQQRVRWEHRHEHLRPLISADWLLEREDLDLAERLNKLGFSWYDAGTDADSQESTRTGTGAGAGAGTALATLQQEYDWWEMYHDFLRYREVNGNGNGYSPLECKESWWYSEELADWLGEQQMMFSKLSQGSEYNEEDIRSTSSMTEWHYRALQSVGFESNTDADADEKFVSHSVGRTPSVLSLEIDLAEEVDDLPRDLQSGAGAGAGGGKRIDKAEQLAWLVRYASLRRYYSKSGPGALSNIGTDDISGQRLALWANNQRKQYSNFTNGKKSTMTRRRMKMLDDIEFDWKLKRPGDKEEWEEMKQELIEFKEQFGHCFIPAAFPRNTRLGQWVSLQRQLYQQSRKKDNSNGLVLPSNLTKGKEKELLDIGLDLTMDNLAFGSMAYETIWMCRIEELAAFKDLQGHCDVPIDYNSPYYDLGLWVREQRILFIRGKEGIPSQLDKRRMDDLEQIGFSWDIERADETM